MKKFLTWSLISLVLLGLAYCSFLYVTNRHTLSIVTSNGIEHKINLLIADTSSEREKGLSGTESLGENEGMYFIHDREANFPYWMIDMKIPLDIIFVDKNKKIIYIAKNAQPCPSEDNCPLITPSSNYLYVIEVNAGYVDKNGIVVGDSIKPNFFTSAP